jgi:hypothetical protein
MWLLAVAASCGVRGGRVTLIWILECAARGQDRVRCLFLGAQDRRHLASREPLLVAKTYEICHGGWERAPQKVRCFRRRNLTELIGAQTAMLLYCAA